MNKFLLLAAFLLLASCENPTQQPPVTTPQDTKAPADVSLLSVVPGNESLSLSWTNPEDSDFSYVEITAPGSTSIQVLKGNSTAIITDLTSWIPYSYTVKSFDSSGNGSKGVSIISIPSGPTTASTYFGSFRKISPVVLNTLNSTSTDWYKDQVFYHIWVKAFNDSNGDGLGDIAGITAKLDYLKNLGVTSLWISPFFKSNSPNANLHGYDVMDHYTVDPRLGTLSDVQTLLRNAHSLNIRVIFDFVPNHVSNLHPWFVDSKSSLNGKRDWFVWKTALPTQGWGDVGGGGPGTGFRAGGTGQYFYGVFWDGMPDLNYRSQEVKTAMANVMTYWLNYGFDGMRVDAVKYLFENEATGANVDQPETIEFFQKVRSEILDPYTTAGASKFMVAENWTSDRTSLNKFMKSDGINGFQGTMDIDLGYGITSIVNGTDATTVIGDYYSAFVKPAEVAGGWTFSYLSNHDNYQSRPASAFYNNQRIRLAQTIQMSAWGTPILYYGNEIAMTGQNTRDDLKMRTNFDWTKVSAAQDAPDSPYNWQKTLNALKTSRESLRRGDFKIVPTEAGNLAILRSTPSESTLLVMNLTPSDHATVSADLTGQTLGAGISTLVGASANNTLSGSTLTLTGLKAYGIRIFALENSSIATLRGDFADSLPNTTVFAVAKDRANAGLKAAFFDKDGIFISEENATYYSNGCYWVASKLYASDQTDGFYQWRKPSENYTGEKISFHLTVTGVGYELWPYHNTGSSSNWYLRGNFNSWGNGLAMTEVSGETGHFFATLTPATGAVSTGVVYKFNADLLAATWDYSFGYWDVAYDETMGVSRTSLNYGYVNPNKDIYFKPDGVSNYEIHFLNQKGICKTWIKKI